MASDRREFMRKMGVAGAAIGATSIAGCSGGGEDTDNQSPDDQDDNVEKQELPEERRIGEKTLLSNTERYWAERYQSNRLVSKWFRDRLGVNVRTDPVEITVLTDREEQGEYDLVTYNWCANNGDPDSIIVDRFRSDGSQNHTRFDHERYNEVATAQRQEVDEEARQELVFEAQQILGEQRPENQFLHNVYPYAYNNERFVEDSIVVNVNGLANIWNYTQIEPKNEEGQTIVTNNWDPSDQLNPLHINAIGPSRNWTPTRFMHDFLVRPDPNLEATPWAAEDYEWDDDTTAVVTLKDGMTFHDGESVTAEDVVYTFNLIMDTEPPAYINNVVDVLESVEQTGDSEITFNLQAPHAPFVAVTLGLTPILPQHYWEELIEETGNEDTPWEISITNDRPIVASGPFEWGNWDQGSRFEMPAFKDHAFAAPNIDRRIQRPLATRDAELQAMVSGDYDLLDYWFGSADRLQQEVEQAQHLSLVETTDDCRQACWVNTENPPFDDVRFRQAANALIMGAQPVIIEEIYDGFGVEAVSPISPELEFWHNPDTPFFEDGVEGARTILQDAGYEWDSDGNLYYPEGETGS